MGATINLPVMLNQTPHVQKLQHAEQAHPEHQQVFVGQEAVEQQKLSRSKVLESDKSNEELHLRKDGKGNGQQTSSKKKKRQSSDDSSKDADEEQGSGRIINLQV